MVSIRKEIRESDLLGYMWAKATWHRWPLPVLVQLKPLLHPGTKRINNSNRPLESIHLDFSRKPLFLHSPLAGPAQIGLGLRKRVFQGMLQKTAPPRLCVLKATDSHTIFPLNGMVIDQSKKFIERDSAAMFLKHAFPSQVSRWNHRSSTSLT